MNIPKLRFKEFTDEWIAIKLNDISKTFDYGMNVASTSFDGKNKYIRITDIDDVSHKFLKNNIVSPSGSLEDKYLVKNDDILFARTGASTGKTYLYNSNDGILYFAGFLIRINVLKSYNSYFIFQNTLTKKYTDWVKVESIRSGQPGINAEQYKSYSIKCPTLAEQNKIANFLTTVDKKITNLENTITSLENQKKELLQQIFSQKLRFKDENGNNYPNWINSTIGKSGYFYYGKSAPKWSITDTATIPCVRYGELYTTHNIMVKKIYSYTNIPKENLKFSTGNEVLVPRVGEEPLDFCKCCYLPFKDVAIGEMISVYNTKNNPLFISYMFNATMKYKFAKLVEGGNVSNLYYSYLENIKIKLPCLEEQTKIADFLSAFDRKLDNQKAQLEHWKQIKKGLLQQMFV